MFLLQRNLIIILMVIESVDLRFGLIFMIRQSYSAVAVFVDGMNNL